MLRAEVGVSLPACSGVIPLVRVTSFSSLFTGYERASSFFLLNL